MEIINSIKRARLDSALGYSQNFLKMSLLDEIGPDNDYKLIDPPAEFAKGDFKLYDLNSKTYRSITFEEIIDLKNQSSK
jgi:hypothetical protein